MIHESNNGFSFCQPNSLYTHSSRVIIKIQWQFENFHGENCGSASKLNLLYALAMEPEKVEIKRNKKESRTKTDKPSPQIVRGLSPLSSTGGRHIASRDSEEQSECHTPGSSLRGVSEARAYRIAATLSQRDGLLSGIFSVPRVHR